jgi:hypothetical protein
LQRSGPSPRIRHFRFDGGLIQARLCSLPIEIFDLVALVVGAGEADRGSVCSGDVTPDNHASREEQNYDPS